MFGNEAAKDLCMLQNLHVTLICRSPSTAHQAINFQADDCAAYAHVPLRHIDRLGY
jgi:hypothetical protein